ncbi:MAG: tetratricopeptide repeat protein [Alphaproteobacteria bacterium]|nr:tetratricopeptide repeat protein [Alphaproteobacteria bacterium]
MAEERAQRRLAAILAADVVGYSRLMGEDETGTLATLKQHRASLIDPTITEHRGRIVKLMGDGVLVEFGSVVDAVECAVSIQRGMVEQNADTPDTSRIMFRIGVNLGDVIIEGDDIYGDGVNVAARLEGLAEPGGICVSAKVFEEIRTKLDLGFDDLGEQSVKNIEAPVRVYSINLGIEPPQRLAGSKLASATEPFAGKPSVAVLPFANMSANPDDEYFSDGLTEDIITELARFRELAVIARNSTFQFKNRATDVAAVGRELGARFVVEGSVRRAGERIRINAQLVEADSGAHVWADRWDRDMGDIFAVQDELTRTIAANLGVRVQDAALDRSLKKHPSDLDAYDCVLRARRYTALLDEDEHAKARDLLEQAIKLDPDYSQAHALLANVYLAEHRFGSNPRPDPIDRGLRMARRAVELDPQNAYARCWLAIVYFFQHENESFQAEALRALALNPNDAETVAEVGHYCTWMGDFERGIALNRQAVALNPLHPGWYYFAFTQYHYNQRDYAQAVADVEKAGMPNFYWTPLMKAAALGELGETERAAAALARMRELKPDLSPREEIKKWNCAPDHAAHLMEGLKKAGLSE